jgi:dihydroxyacid dehydratase/phosphogluconate dehydratase
MNKPQVGIASMWYEGNPCNMHLLNLAEEVKRGVVSVLLLGVKCNYSLYKSEAAAGLGLPSSQLNSCVSSRGGLVVRGST